MAKQFGRDTNVTNFPSHLISPKEKQKDSNWCLSYIKAFHAEFTQGNANNQFRPKSELYTKWRKIARAQNDINVFKTRLGEKRNLGKGKKNESYRALHWGMLPIAPKFVKILIDKIQSQDRGIAIKAIDPKSVSEQRKKRYEIEEHLQSQALLAGVSQKTGIGFESPLDENLPQPKNMGDIPRYQDIFYKDRMVLELKDVVDLNFSINDWSQVRREYNRDLVEVGVGGTKTYIDHSNGAVKMRRVIPERVIVNKVEHDDYRDAQRVGEYVYHTISELKQRNPGLPEETYRKMANAAGKNNYPQDASFYYSYYNDNHSYPWDSEYILCLDAEWFSVDNVTKVWKRTVGGKPVSYEKNPEWTTSMRAQGVSDKDYEAKYPGRKIIRTEIKNVYKATWIVGTEVIFDWGLCTDMYRASSNLGETKLSYTLHTMEGDSLMRMIEPIIDSAQLNWLQYQHHVTKSRPAGLSIEFSALEDVALSKGGDKMTPKQVLALYMETGILVWRRKKWGGSSDQWKPIEELQNGINKAAFEHFDNVIKCIDLLRNVIGLTQVLDASIDNERVGKAVTEIAAEASEHAIKNFFYADKKIAEDTAKMALQFTQDTISMHGGVVYEEAIGKDSIAFLKSITDLGLREFSLTFDAAFDAEKKQVVERMLEKYIDHLDPDVVMEIVNDNNPMRAIAILKQRVEQSKQEAAKQQEQMAQMETQKNIDSANAAAEAEKGTMSHETKEKLKYETGASEIRVQEEGKLMQMKVLLIKLEKGLELDEQEEILANKLQVTTLKGGFDLEKQRLANKKPQPTPSPSK